MQPPRPSTKEYATYFEFREAFQKVLKRYGKAFGAMAEHDARVERKQKAKPAKKP